jgi:hypothetical protein
MAVCLDFYLCGSANELYILNVVNHSHAHEQTRCGMSISIIDPSRLLNEELRQLVERRLLFALSRFDSRIRRVDFVVSDENGPRGGIDKACLISIALERAPVVVIREKDENFSKCITRAAERAGRAVARTIEKTRRNTRPQTVYIGGLTNPSRN